MSSLEPARIPQVIVDARHAALPVALGLQTRRRHTVALEESKVDEARQKTAAEKDDRDSQAIATQGKWRWWD